MEVQREISIKIYAAIGAPKSIKQHPLYLTPPARKSIPLTHIASTRQLWLFAFCIYSSIDENTRLWRANLEQEPTCIGHHRLSRSWIDFLPLRKFLTWLVPREFGVNRERLREEEGNATPRQPLCWESIIKSGTRWRYQGDQSTEDDGKFRLGDLILFF